MGLPRKFESAKQHQFLVEFFKFCRVEEFQFSSKKRAAAASFVFFLLVLVKLRVEGGEMKCRASGGALKGLPGKDLWSLKLPVLARSRWEW